MEKSLNNFFGKKSLKKTTKILEKTFKKTKWEKNFEKIFILKFKKKFKKQNIENFFFLILGVLKNIHTHKDEFHKK